MTRPPPNLDAFAATAERSRLVSREGITAARSSGAVVSAEQLAGRLVTDGHLTRFQADKLLGGFWQGLVIGPYRLMCPIGRGGVGIVYLARDDRRPAGKHTPRLFALKLLSPTRAKKEPRTLARFRREMDLGPVIPPHPHLARTLDAGTADGVNFVVMEYVPGLTAKQTVIDRGPMPVADAARVFADVATGLHAAHQAGFIHRDTKPSNVIVTPGGRGKLLDFGFALRRGERPSADPAITGGKGYTVGTADYLPPEQASNAVAVGAETDIYSLGCSLYYVLTGRPPHAADTSRAKIRLHQTAEPLSISLRNPSVPRGFAALVAWLMAKRPEDRPQSAALVATELEAWARPVVPTADRLSYDATWEAGILKQVETAWLASRPAKAADEAPVVQLELPLPIARPVNPFPTVIDTPPAS